MNTWYALTIEDYKQAINVEEEIQKAFTSLFLENKGKTNLMAAFTAQDINTSAVTVYFTPNSISIAKMFNVAPCAKPQKSELGLIVGDTRDVEALLNAGTSI